MRRRRTASRKPTKAPQTIKAKRGAASKPARNRRLPALSKDTELARLARDMPADPEYTSEVTVAGRWRSILAVPMFREGDPIGAIVITRSEAGRFAEGQPRHRVAVNRPGCAGPNE